MPEGRGCTARTSARPVAGLGAVVVEDVLAEQVAETRGLDAVDELGERQVQGRGGVGEVVSASRIPAVGTVGARRRTSKSSAS